MVSFLPSMIVHLCFFDSLTVAVYALLEVAFLVAILIFNHACTQTLLTTLPLNTKKLFNILPITPAPQTLC